MKIDQEFRAAVGALYCRAEQALKGRGAPLGLYAHKKQPEAPTCVIVDAEVDCSRALGEYLAARGLKVWTAPSGEEALRVIQRVQPALVLVDLMPVGIGECPLLAGIRKISPKSRIIVLTGWVPSHINSIVQWYQVDACCLKPVSVEAVQQIIGKTLNEPSLIMGNALTITH